jgi:hypothetical protein
MKRHKPIVINDTKIEKSFIVLECDLKLKKMTIKEAKKMKNVETYK